MPSVRKFCQAYKYKLAYPIAKRSALRKMFGTKIRTTTNRKRKFGETKLSAGINPRAKLQKIPKTINYKDLPNPIDFLGHYSIYNEDPSRPRFCKNQTILGAIFTRF